MTYIEERGSGDIRVDCTAAADDSGSANADP